MGRIKRQYFIVIATGCVLIAAVFAKYNADIQSFRDEFQHLAYADAQAVGEQYTNAIRAMYQGLRTIARLPGTRLIDRYGKNLDETTRESIQEIYNNLYDNIALSEVYIVPADFDPDVKDAATGKLSEPIITYDEFIVGKLAEKSHSKDVEVEEIEIHEYRLMKKQLQWMKQNYPTESHIKDLQYPAISGQEVITCDNSMFSAINPDDKDRSGLVYSVPFYGPDGKLKGLVTGVILSHRLRNYLPSGKYVISNSTYNYLLTPTTAGPWQEAMTQIRNNVPDNSLSYSVVFELGVIDAAKWRLWVGISSDYFTQLPRVNAEKNFLAMALVAVASLIITFLILIRSQQQHREDNLKLRLVSLAKTEFISRMSHELRTPLNAIIGYSEILMEQIGDRKLQQYDDCMKIRHAGTHLLNLINDILDIEKIESGRLSLNIETFYVDTFLLELISTVKPLIAKNNNEFITSGIHDRRLVKADEMKLKQILLNLLSNAAKFTKNGKISLSISTASKDNCHWIVFTISDTGIGIAADKISTIFEEFSQADATINKNYGGTGLGLTISKKFCEMMGGHISVESELEVGSVFSVWIPADEMEKQKHPASAVA